VKALAGLITAGLGLAAAMALSIPAHSQGKQLAQANAALQAGETDKALALLEPLTQPEGEAEAYNLRCRVEYTLEEWDRAANDCEQAVKLDGQSSDDHMWLARALGQKASKATFLSAFSLAKRARTEFEEAVRLNPRNAGALADLGEFYYSAPGVVGGGISKSETVAAELDKIDPARAHELRGRIAEQHKDYDTAEREYKLSIASSGHPARQWMALASFYRGRERWTEMESAVRSGESAAQRDGQSGVALFNGASLLRETGRDPARAARMLESYLASSAKTEEGPAFVAHVWLAQLKEQLGDAAAAKRERAAALALAHEYKPAQDLKY
jgi:tetratricopeptide (TPR) repeat protein